MTQNAEETNYINIDQLPGLTKVQRHWHVLDIALDTADLALEFTAHAAQVSLVTTNPEVCQKARNRASGLEGGELSCEVRDMSTIFPDQNGQFDLITNYHSVCKLGSLKEFLQSSQQVLKEAGMLLIVDQIIPGSHLRGKKAKKLRKAGQYIHTFLQLNESIQHTWYSEDQWREAITRMDFAPQQIRKMKRVVDFEAWANPNILTPADKIRLRAMLIQSPEKAWEFLTPKVSGDRIEFHLTEILILATKKADTD